MRVVLVVPGFGTGDDDWCVPAVSHLAHALGRAHSVSVIALRHPQGRTAYRAHGATVHALGGGLAGGLARLPLLARALARACSVKFDAIHGMWADEPGAVAAAAGRLRSRPSVVSLMGGEAIADAEIGYGGRLSRANRALSTLAVARATHLTVGSEYLAGAGAPLLKERRAQVVPLGVDVTMFHPVPAPDDPALTGRPVLLQVASLVKVKDHDTALLALRAVVSDWPEAHLHLVGEGPELERLRRRAADLGLSGRVTFHGEVDHGRLPGYYRAADALLLTSRFESQAMVVLEAAACGRPTIGRPVGVLPELQREDAAVTAGDAVDLAAVLLDVLGRPRLLEHTGIRAREAVERRFTLDQAVRAFEQLYASP